MISVRQAKPPRTPVNTVFPASHLGGTCSLWRPRGYGHMCCVLGWSGRGSRCCFRMSITLSSPFVSGNNENAEIQAHSDNLDRACNDEVEDTVKEKTDSQLMGLLQQVHSGPAFASLHIRSRLHTDGHFLRPVDLFSLTIPIQGKKHKPKIRGLKWMGRKHWESINIPVPLLAYLVH